MIDIAAARQRIAVVVDQAVTAHQLQVNGPVVTVYQKAIDGLATFPAVVIGMPKWTPGPTFCLDTYEFPVGVIASRPGASDVATVAGLDELWPVVLEALRESDYAEPSRAEFMQFPIQGQSYPAQVIFATITS